MAETASVTVEYLTGNLAFLAGGLSVEDLVGAFVKSVNTTGALVVQLSDGSETTVQLAFLTQDEVDARVQAGVLDWAETDNTDTIPANKLATANTPPAGDNDTSIATTAFVQGLNGPPVIYDAGSDNPSEPSTKRYTLTSSITNFRFIEIELMNSTATIVSYVSPVRIPVSRIVSGTSSGDNPTMNEQVLGFSTLSTVGVTEFVHMQRIDATTLWISGLVNIRYIYGVY